MPTARDEFLREIRKQAQLAQSLVLGIHKIEDLAMEPSRQVDRSDRALPSEVLFQMLDSAPTLLVELRNDDQDDPIILKAGHLLEELLGYFKGELEWKPLTTVIGEARRDVHRQHIASFKMAPRDRNMGEGIKLLEARRKDGTLLPVSVYLKTFGCQGRLYTVATVMPQRATQSTTS